MNLLQIIDPWVAQLVKNLPAMWETWVQSLGWDDPLEEGTTTRSSILAWRIPRATVHGVVKSWTQPSDFHFPSLHLCTCGLKREGFTGLRQEAETEKHALGLSYTIRDPGFCPLLSLPPFVWRPLSSSLLQQLHLPIGQRGKGTKLGQLSLFCHKSFLRSPTP